MPQAALAQSLVRALPASSRPLAELIERLRTPLAAHGLAFALHETTSTARPYLLAALIRVESGYMLKRDPDNQNAKPQGEAARLPRREPRDVWQDLTAVKCPTGVSVVSAAMRPVTRMVRSRVEPPAP